ncbi:beta-ketoacyl synthase N-terminal-like domain-containing protein [Nocardiopsis halotolerans]|uniref:beta-ketoacyl synthase N-terminal-like domain-containing protein n=1 Tax=Nocardiopsis halotolerans TaxID=124252 RepID=UPI0003479FB6|nr:beta-ketoacyl synthase N-terminal-like domain-containing protein [Nocardiopsis halotolerans]
MTATMESPTDLTTVEPLPVRAAGVVSTAGIGLAPLAELVSGGTPAHTEPEDDGLGDYPLVPVRPVGGFRLADHIGRKGTRHLDRLTGFGLVACDLALQATDAPPAAKDRTGIVIGTSTGSVQSLSELARDTLLQERPYLINPSRFPNTVMNSCAGRIAIRNGFRGMNATLAAGRLSSLTAFRHARIALSQGRADRLLVGGVEELTAPTAWAWYLSGGLTEETPVGEGGAVFDLGRGGDDAAVPGGADSTMAELLGCEVSFAARRGLSESLTRDIRVALARSSVTSDQIDMVVPGANGHVGTGRAEARALSAVVGDRPAVPFVQSLGETYSASGALQLAAVLALWKVRPSARRRHALITSVGADGNTGALVVRESEGASVDAAP